MPVVSRITASAAGANGCNGPARHRARRAPGYRAKDFQCVLEIPFSINCLYRRPARSSGLAVRNTLSGASGKTTVPMSRPSATRPGGRRKARCRSSSAARTAGMDRDPRCGGADVFPPDAVGDVAAVEQDPAVGEARRRGSRRPSASAGSSSERDARFERLQRDEPIERSAVEQMEAERRATPAAIVPLPDAAGPSTVITGTCAAHARWRSSQRDSVERREVAGKGLAHALGIEDAHGTPPSAASEKHIAIRWSS